MTQGDGESPVRGPAERRGPREVVVCKLDELPPGERREIDVGGRHAVCVFNVAGELVALRNLCPHRGGALTRGFVGPLVTADAPGGFRYEREGEILHCPTHQWEFDLKTGCALHDPRLCAKTYRVSVRGDQVILHTPDGHHHDGGSGR